MRVEDIDPERPLFVKNITNGDFLIPIRDMSGSTELVSIPKTFIPILITNFAEGLAFKKSSDFRKAVAKGYLIIIPENDAENELMEETSILELERLRKTEFSNIDYEIPKSMTPLEAINDVGTDTVSSKVKDIIIRADMAEDEKLALLILEHKTGNMKSDDYEFVVMTSGEKSKLSKWASKSMISEKSNLFNKPGEQNG